MSGVLFIICIPRENYENCLRGNKENVLIETRKPTNLLQKQESLSNESDGSSSSTSKVSIL